MMEAGTETRGTVLLAAGWAESGVEARGKGRTSL